MALGKATTTFMFGKGTALKDDPLLIPMGKFQSLQNCVFDTLAQLKKRNGNGLLTSTIGSLSYLTTFEKNLIGLGSSIQSYSSPINTFIYKGVCPRVQVSTIPISNVLFGQSYSDLAISNNGLMCQVAQNTFGGGFVVPTYTWTILDQATGQIIAGPNQIISSGGTQRLPPKVFAVGSQFVVLYDGQTPQSVGSSCWFQYVTIPTSSPFTTSAAVMISSNAYTMNAGWFDGAVASTSGLFLSWAGVGPGISQGVYSTLVNPVTKTQSPIRLQQPAALRTFQVNVAPDYTTVPYTMWTGVIFGAGIPNTGIGTVYLSMTPQGSQTSSSIIYVDGSGSVAISSSSFNIKNLAMTAQNGSMTAYVEVANSYGYNDSIKTNLIYTQELANTGTGSAVYNTKVIARGLGLASKGFIVNSSSYVLGQWLSPFQSTYFLINSSGQVQSKLAYGNANNASYYTQGLPNVSVIGSSAYMPYLVQETVQPVGTGTNVGSQSLGIYGSLGVNVVGFNFSSPIAKPKEIGQNLILGGGFLGAYDGQQFTENNFFLFPDSVQIVSGSNSGALSAQTYFYQAIYQWSDNKGNIFRSAPSIPVSITNSTGSSFNAVYVPTLRTSYKNYPYYGGFNAPIQIKLFRWSQAQPIYYSTANFVQDATVSSTDYTVFLDGRADSGLIGGEILYTNGGVVEDVNGPATKAMTTFDSRLWLIDGEDQNLLWFSKQVIESTPVEMSDLFTFYVAPNVGSEGPTGVMNCLAPMDDKLIIFKDSALYYINGRGPDNTGAQNQYSDPIFITSAVGCNNQNSIVLIPNGLMFQSTKGIWILGRDLSTQYIGKDVESLVNTNVVLSAITIPNTNQVRFTLNTGITLLYDYFVGEWASFVGMPGISSTLYKGLHTYVNSSSTAYQETPNVFSDGPNPVLMSFTTGWIGLSGLQGYQRAYSAYLLGTYYTPHNFTMGIGYDYNTQIKQLITVNPTNTTGSGSIVEQWRLNFTQQSCESFQLTFNEVASQSAGQGLTISGLDFVYGQIKGYPRNIGPNNQKS